MSLNKEQNEAVETTEGALLVLAGAGTGKTRVLTTRIAYILEQNLAFPSQILAVTFTNKAAKEMRGRIEDMVGQEMSSGLWLGTFHSICLKILRRHAELTGLGKDFSIIDQDDQLRLIKQLVAENGIDDKRYPPKMIASQINRWKDKALTPDKIDGNSPESRIYELYQTRLRNMNSADFGDLMLHCITLLLNNADVLAEYHRRFHYIMVDEYQDTNVAQYLWLRLLAQEKHNICCVGDDDQSIYGWRGAEVGNILKFEKDFENAKVIRLEKNYRSTQDILSTASALIANNKSRLGKVLWSDKKEGNPVKVISMWNERVEAEYVGREIESIQTLKKCRMNDVAILVRAGYQTRPFEECFVSMGIPYRVIGGMRFYERMEIRDAIAYMRIISQPANDLALLRIINTPKRGIGSTTVENIRQFARENNISLTKTIRRMLDDNLLKSRVKATLSTLMDNFRRWHKMLETESHIDVVKAILNESGYMNMWKNEKTPEAQGRVENLKELISALREFEDLPHFLEHVSLVTDGDDTPESDMVSIVTMHGAKGLEFDTVFLTGWEEGLFPSQRSIDEKGEEGLEEERRLAYVGITRAKNNLFISFASSRFVYGQTISSIPSRFIDELPKEHIEMVNTGKSGIGASYKTPTKNKWNAASQKSSSESTGEFKHYDRIFHQKFGYGKIIEINGKHLKISFEKSGTKTLMQDYVKKA